jgi:hypothetical protein
MAWTAGDTLSNILQTYTNTLANGVLYCTVARTPGGELAVTQNFVATVQALPPAKFTSISVTTGTLAAGNASGAQIVYLLSTGATPGSQAMRTPAQILADTPGLTVGQSYTLRVLNTGAGTFTLATDSGTGFTMTGTMTVAQNVWTDFIVTLSTGSTGIVQNVGKGTIS